MLEYTVEVFYCYHCKGLVFRLQREITIQVTSNRYLDTRGYEQEEEQVTNEHECWDVCCGECDETVSDKVQVPYSMFQKIYKEVHETEASLYPLDLKTDDINEIENVSEAIFEALI